MTECSICLANITDDCCIVRMTCRHAFHFQCIKQWSAYSARCPLCRQSTLPSFHRAFTPVPILTIPLTPEILYALFPNNMFSPLTPEQYTDSDDDSSSDSFTQSNGVSSDQ